MELSKEAMTRLRAKELAILQAFIAVCQQLNVQYFIVQGTLLGAIRHQGFIPWDDDIDIGMLREDYEIFLAKGQALLPKQLFIQTSQTDPFFPHGFAKVRDTSTSFVETTCKNLPMNHGIFIDIFPFDYYPDKKRRQFTFEIKKLLLRYRIRQELYIPADHTFSMINIGKNLLKGFSKLIYPSYSQALIAQMLHYQSVKAGNFCINNGSPWGKRECIPTAWLKEVMTVQFEGIELCAPKCYHQYLSHVYGDYLKLPPEEKRVPHHYICDLNFESGK